MTWETIYSFLGITDFINFISSQQIQDMLMPVKVVFIFCSIFFLIFVIFFMINSSWLQYKFLEDVAEFFSWQAYGQKAMQKKWDRVKKRAEAGTEADYKLAIIDADDLLIEILDDRGYDGKDFEERSQKASRLLGALYADVLKAHETRNSIVYNPDFKLSADEAKRALDAFERAAKGIGMG